MNRAYWTVVFICFGLACGFLVQGVYGQQKVNNQACITMGSTAQCMFTGAAWCNDSYPTEKECTNSDAECEYCNSSQDVSRSDCFTWEGYNCTPNGEGPWNCGADNNTASGTCGWCDAGNGNCQCGIVGGGSCTGNAKAGPACGDNWIYVGC